MNDEWSEVDPTDEQREFDELQRQEAEAKANMQAIVDEWTTHTDEPGKVHADTYNSVILRGDVIFIFTAADNIETDYHITNIWRMASTMNPEGMSREMVNFDCVTHSESMTAEQWYWSCVEWLDQQAQVDARYSPVALDKSYVLYGS